ncbi:MAG: hypothetical protein AAF713_14020 [Pseudomonadota bacterium]
MFERLLVGLKWRAAFLDPLLEDHAFRFQIADALFVAADHSRAVLIEQAIHELGDLAFHLQDVGFHAPALRLHGRGSLIPEIAKE